MTLVAAISIGFALQTFLLSSATLRQDHWKKVTLLAIIWCILPVSVELILMLFLDRSETGDISGFALLSFLFVAPFYGFLNARLLQSINEESLLFLSLAVLYLLFIHVWHPFWLILTIIPVLTLLLRHRNQDSLLAPMLGYGLFLFLLITVTLLQFQRIYVTMALPENQQPGFFDLLMGSMLALYLAFHLWFAAKFIMIAFTCIRFRGRELARPLFQSKMRNRHLPYPAIILVLFIQAMIYAGNARFGWLAPELVIEASILFLPQAVNFWLRSSNHIGA